MLALRYSANVRVCVCVSVRAFTRAVDINKTIAPQRHAKPSRPVTVTTRASRMSHDPPPLPPIMGNEVRMCVCARALCVSLSAVKLVTLIPSSNHYRNRWRNLQRGQCKRSQRYGQPKGRADSIARLWCNRFYFLARRSTRVFAAHASHCAVLTLNTQKEKY